ncbi:MAG: SPOR domain-containing protein [Halioglobus sp.]
MFVAARNPLFAILLLLLAQGAFAVPALERGHEAFERGDFAGAASIWRALALAGDSTAQLNLGQMYRLGTGVQADDKEAVKWYSMAAKQGSETAQYNLLLMQKDGRASREDLSLAFQGQGQAAKIGSREIPYSWLMRLPDEALLIQIIGSSNKQAVEEHIGNHLASVSPKTRVIIGTNQGVNWHIALMGPFATREEANIALQRLPSDVKKGKPWIRSAASAKAAAKTPD